MNRAFPRSVLLAFAVALVACGGNPAKPEPVAADTPAAAQAEGRKIEGLKLSPGVTDIAKQEGKVELTKDDRVKCEKYKPLGSNRTQYRCTTLAEEKATAEQNAATMRKLQTPPPSATGSIGN